MMYMVLGASTLNMVLSHPDDIDTSGWAPEEMSNEIKRQFEGWDPWFVVSSSIELTDTVTNTFSLVDRHDETQPGQLACLPSQTSSALDFKIGEVSVNG
jgi:hypothetical protein